MSVKSSNSGDCESILELILGVFLVVFLVWVFSNWYDRAKLDAFLMEAQLSEEPAKALFVFNEEYIPMFLDLGTDANSIGPNVPVIPSVDYDLMERESGATGLAQAGKTVKGTLKQGESLEACFKRNKVPRALARLLVKALKKVHKKERFRPGEQFVLKYDDKSGSLISLTWEKGPFDVYEVKPRDNAGKGYKVSRMPITVEKKTVKITGHITGSLQDSFANYGINPKIARNFVKIFSTRIDFNSDVKIGDFFSIILNKYYKNGHDLGPGRILAARYCSRDGRCLEAYYYKDSTMAKGHYFAPDGQAINNSFLRSPLKVYKVTSRFTYRRYHPVLKVYRPHYGVDLAAPRGTPVMAVADGKVIFTGWQRGYGRMVVLKHKGGYKTYYGHLSRFGKGIRKGVHVKQRQVIGYVGRSGYATGPHLDYRVWHNGRFVNPFRVSLARARNLSRRQRRLFVKKYHTLQRLLRNKGFSGIISVKKEVVEGKPEDFMG